MSKAVTQTKRSRRWMLWLLSATVLLIGTVFVVLHLRARAWMRHVAVIESHGGTISGSSSAPDWLLRLASDESQYLGYCDAESIGPDWLRKHLPTDGILRCCDRVERVELGYYRGMRVHSSFSGRSGDAKLDANVLRHLEAFPRLKELNLRNTEIDDSCLAGLKGVTSLRWLSLEKTSISNAGLKHLEKLTNLEELLLSGTEISDAGLKHLENLSRLRRLDLEGTNITDAGLVSIRHLRKLVVLDLSGTEIRGRRLSELAPLQELKWLDLSWADLNDGELAELAVLTKLQFLFVASTELTTASVKPLKRLKGLKLLSVGFPCDTIDQLQKGLSSVDVRQAPPLSLDFGGYEDLLNSIDDPAYHGPASLLQVISDEDMESFFESIRESMGDWNNSNEEGGAQPVGGDRLKSGGGLGF